MSIAITTIPIPQPKVRGRKAEPNPFDDTDLTSYIASAGTVTAPTAIARKYGRQLRASFMARKYDNAYKLNIRYEGNGENSCKMVFWLVRLDEQKSGK